MRDNWWGRNDVEFNYLWRKGDSADSWKLDIICAFREERRAIPFMDNKMEQVVFQKLIWLEK